LKTLSKSSLNLISHYGFADLTRNDKCGMSVPDRSLKESKKKEFSNRRLAQGDNQSDPFGFGLLVDCGRMATLKVITLNEITSYVLLRGAS